MVFNTSNKDRCEFFHRKTTTRQSKLDTGLGRYLQSTVMGAAPSEVTPSAEVVVYRNSL